MLVALMIMACDKDKVIEPAPQPTTLPLSNMNWVCSYIHSDGFGYVNPAPGVFESVTEGLKIYGTGYRGGALIHPVPLAQYPIANKTLYFKWKANGGGDFMGIFPMVFTDSNSWITPYYMTNLTTDHIYLDSYLITEDMWYYTRIIMGSTTYIATTATGNYDNSGGTVVQTKTANLDHDYMCIYFSIVDCYASTAAYAVLGEVRIEQTNNHENGLVAYYPFDGNANDESGNGHHGTLTNVTLTTDRFGDSSAYLFTGANSKITTTWQGILGNQPRSVSMWVKSEPNSDPLTHAVELYGGGGGTSSPGSNWCCTIHHGSSLSATIGIWGGGMSYATVNDDSLWHHYVWVLPDSNPPRLRDFKIYQDGILLDSVLVSENENTIINTLPGDPIGFGQYVRSNGSVDDARIYNYAISDVEIQALYHERGW
jgi:hypothetical protein